MEKEKEYEVTFDDINPFIGEPDKLTRSDELKEELRTLNSNIQKRKEQKALEEKEKSEAEAEEKRLAEIKAEAIKLNEAEKAGK